MANSAIQADVATAKLQSANDNGGELVLIRKRMRKPRANREEQTTVSLFAALRSRAIDALEDYRGAGATPDNLDAMAGLFNLRRAAEAKLPRYNLRCVVNDKREVAIRWREAWLEYMAAAADADAACYRHLIEAENGMSDGPMYAARNVADKRKAGASDKLMRVPAPTRNDIATKIKVAGRWNIDRNEAWQICIAEDEARHLVEPKSLRKRSQAIATC